MSTIVHICIVYIELWLYTSPRLMFLLDKRQWIFSVVFSFVPFTSLLFSPLLFSSPCRSVLFQSSPVQCNPVLSSPVQSSQVLFGLVYSQGMTLIFHHSFLFIFNTPDNLNAIKTVNDPREKSISSLIICGPMNQQIADLTVSMMASYQTVYRIIGPSWGESTGH